ncbi:MAG TPA: right-handed parallel beta-helix repeat-containing protein, partial [Lentisphaeria bacterium]|nr:right-handed parallel beta-helix repeat-containing protein [Lentisphaeria bacterium]
MTVASKLQTLAAIKAAQYEAIIAKGGTLSPGDWSAYAAAIAALPSGGGAYNPDFPSPIFNFFPSDTFVNGDEPTSKAWYVRPGGSGDKDGRDWDNAFATREDAIEAAESGDHIRVMEGLYYIGTIQIPKYGVSEYYGFTQADGTWATRNPWLHPSKLDACFTSNRWQNDTVVFPIWQVVDGLYVQNVFAGRGITSMQAGKFRNVSAVNCDNTGRNGGGMYFVTCSVEGCFVTKCSGGNGGGAYAANSSSLTNCSITNCSGSAAGGGVYADNSSSLTNCAITNCSGSAAGGGVYVTGGSSLTNCVITNNTCTNINCYGG